MVFLLGEAEGCAVFKFESTGMEEVELVESSG